MTKYDIRPKSSSGLLHSSSHTPDSLRLTFRIAPYRSQKFHATRPGARPAVLKPRQRPHATRAAPEEPDDLAFYHRLHSYRDRGDAGHRLQGGPEDSGNGDWADESTLIAMLQDGYAYTLHLTHHTFLLDVSYLSAIHSRTKTVAWLDFWTA